ncbi:hypothetical protein C818_00482 [Lachnospiraceae bacterium MD308]|jgi:ABC-type sugar transport system, periplasmic component|nr:hypothetical protein C818_00482 [Lachnospiraceae bacterium MD308]MCI8503460.1 sugar ABC transporter substrate-binding protein [Dorea sp.]
MKKRVIAVMAVILICILGMSGCKKHVGTPEDNAASGEETEESETGSQEKKLIGFSVIDMKNPYFITLENAAREVIEKKGYEFIAEDPGTDPTQQAVQIQEMIDKGICAIILSPVDWEKITPSLQALKEAGVRIINVDTQVREMDYVDAYIGSDNYSAGYICGEDLIEKCPEGGKIAILECPTQNSINDRITGFEEAIAKAAKGFEVVARADTTGEFERALEESEKMLKEHPDIVAIMCGNDQIAVGATTSVNVARAKEVLIYGVDGSPDIKKELQKQDTQIAGTAAQSPIHMGKNAAEIADCILTGQKFEKETYEEVFMINKDNVGMYGVDGWQ